MGAPVRRDEDPAAWHRVIGTRPSIDGVAANRESVDMRVRQPVAGRGPALPIVGGDEDSAVCSGIEGLAARDQRENETVRQAVTSRAPACPTICRYEDSSPLGARKEVCSAEAESHDDGRLGSVCLDPLGLRRSRQEVQPEQINEGK